MRNIYRLTIEKQSNCITVYGTEEIIKAELDAWYSFENSDTQLFKESIDISKEHFNPRAYEVRKIMGFCNDATRSETIVAYRFIDVVGMSIMEL